MFIPLNKSSVNKTELSWGKIRGKIGFGGVKKRHGGWEKKSSNKVGPILLIRPNINPSSFIWLVYILSSSQQQNYTASLISPLHREPLTSGHIQPPLVTFIYPLLLLYLSIIQILKRSLLENL
jgi:hypothetical protein